MSAISFQDFRFSPVASIPESSEIVLSAFHLEYEATLHFRANIEVSNFVLGGSIKLQHKSIDGSFVDVPSANASVNAANGTVSINLLVERAGDQSSMPLNAKCRIVAVTDAGESFDVSRISIQNKA